MKRIYLDNASITPIDKEVMKTISEYSSSRYANPSSIHKEGLEAKKAIEEAKDSIAKILGGHSDEIIFTSGGTEANNLAIFGLYKYLINAGKKPNELHMITSEIEHASVLECVRHLETLGVKIDYIGVNNEGIVNLEEIKEKIRPETFLVSIMYVNNEIGTIEPISEIAKLIRKHNSLNPASQTIKTLFHSDASQAPLFLKIQVETLGVDMITLDGQKIYGPRGMGVLWKRRKVSINPIILGGGQQSDLRSGTENVAGTVGMAKALEISENRREKDSKRIAELSKYFIGNLIKIYPAIVINGSDTQRVPSNINISLPGIDNEFFLLQLDTKGIACSTKSSCQKDESESYVVKALGKDEETARSSIRFSLSRETTKKDIKYVLEVIEKIIHNTKKTTPQHLTQHTNYNI